jgi:UDP-glucose 4-epimerase
MVYFAVDRQASKQQPFSLQLEKQARPGRAHQHFIHGNLMSILVIGGAGYIGSHMVKRLLGVGRDVIVYDNLVTGFRDAVMGGTFVNGDIGDRDALKALFAEYSIDAVMHFASFIRVEESVANPQKYYHNNLAATLVLLDEMRQAGVNHFVFSSTAAIFGEPLYSPIDESHQKQPINPYGRSKWMIEQILDDYDAAYGLKSVCLRYFNAAGADPDGELSERHEPETHLIPILLQVASGRRDHAYVFGTDYPTADGTCVRDYIHVADLCEAHLLALDYLACGGRSNRFNLGNGNGFSVAEVIATVKKVTGRPLMLKYTDRRAGDPAVLVANAEKARQILGWSPRYPDLRNIVAHAWAIERRNIVSS